MCNETPEQLAAAWRIGRLLNELEWHLLRAWFGSGRPLPRRPRSIIRELQAELRLSIASLHNADPAVHELDQILRDWRRQFGSEDHHEELYALNRQLNQLDRTSTSIADLVEEVTRLAAHRIKSEIAELRSMIRSRFSNTMLELDSFGRLFDSEFHPCSEIRQMLTVSQPHRAGSTEPHGAGSSAPDILQASAWLQYFPLRERSESRPGPDMIGRLRDAWQASHLLHADFPFDADEGSAVINSQLIQGVETVIRSLRPIQYRSQPHQGIHQSAEHLNRPVAVPSNISRSDSEIESGDEGESQAGQEEQASEVCTPVAAECEPDQGNTVLEVGTAEVHLTSEAETDVDEFEFRGVHVAIDRATGSIAVGERRGNLPSSRALRRLLIFLLQNDRHWPPEQLRNRWSSIGGGIVSESTVRSTISRLRHEIEELGLSIDSRRSLGYRLRVND